MSALIAVLAVSSWSVQFIVLADDVFSSSAHLRLLADGEERLVDALTTYLNTERRRLEQLEQLVFIAWLI